MRPLQTTLHFERTPARRPLLLAQASEHLAPERLLVRIKANPDHVLQRLLRPLLVATGPVEKLQRFVRFAAIPAQQKNSHLLRSQPSSGDTGGEFGVRRFNARATVVRDQTSTLFFLRNE